MIIVLESSCNIEQSSLSFFKTSRICGKMKGADLKKTEKLDVFEMNFSYTTFKEFTFKTVQISKNKRSHNTDSTFKKSSRKL